MVGNDYATLAMFIILGSVLMVTYYFCYKTSNKIDYWTNNGKNILKNDKRYIQAYTGMIIIAGLSGLYLMYYLTCEIPTKKIFGKSYDEIKNIIYVGVLLLIGFSILWVPSIIVNETRITNICLFIVAIGAVIILSSVSSVNNKNAKDNVAIFASIILVIQTLILDFLIWSSILTN